MDDVAKTLEIAATLYGVGAAATVLLQARQIHRRGSSSDVSARFFASYLGGYAMWLLYGLSIQSLPLILVDAFGLVCSAITLGVMLSVRGSLLHPATWSGSADGSLGARQIVPSSGDAASEPEMAPRLRAQQRRGVDRVRERRVSHFDRVRWPRTRRLSGPAT